jgi:hypothetical protein
MQRCGDVGRGNIPHRRGGHGNQLAVEARQALEIDRDTENEMEQGEGNDAGSQDR